MFSTSFLLTQLFVYTSLTSFILFSCGSKWTQNQPKSRLLAKKERQITHFSVIYEVKWTV